MLHQGIAVACGAMLRGREAECDQAASLHAASLQAALAHAADAQAASLQAASLQAASLQAADAQAASLHAALPQAAFAWAADCQAALSKTLAPLESVVRNWSRPAFGFGGFSTLRAAATFSSPTPSDPATAA